MFSSYYHWRGHWEPVMQGRLAMWLGRIALGTLLLITLLAVIVAFQTSRVRLPGEETVPAGSRRNMALYVPMRDGTQIAVDVWLPPDLAAGERVPVLMCTTRYWRAVTYTFTFRAMVALHLVQPDMYLYHQGMFFNGQHFAVIYVDARGSGASSGTRITEYSPDEIADLGEMAEWAARQWWSNGRVGAFGISYDGNTAELSAVPNSPVVRAVAPLYDDFDTLLGLAHPGGVYDSGMIEAWSNTVGGLDRNDVCTGFDVTGWACWKLRWLVRGVKPVDSDPDGRQLAKILSERGNPPLTHSLGVPEFRDDDVQTPKGPINLSQITPFGLRAQIESSRVPMMVWCGWLDAGTCDGALSRYRNFTNVQQVVIGAFSHGGEFNVDPFLPLDKHSSPNPPMDEQYRIQAQFFELVLRADHPEPLTSGIRYYTMGEGKWHTTSVWPPQNGSIRRYYLSGNSLPGSGRNPITAKQEEGSLGTEPPAAKAASDSYAVDFSTTTCKYNRWYTQLGGYDVIYSDRSEEDKKLLIYTGAPLDRDTEITGSPTVTLVVSSSHSDGALHVYLEDVAPDGRVTYITEGAFRLLNRKIATKPLPYIPLGPRHSFLRTDAEVLIPGQPAEIAFSLFSTSVVLGKGHSIRLAIAGADSSMFQRYPAQGSPVLTVYRQRDQTSYLELPVRNR
jgi:putative CocE/NonD family hydrolase